MARVIPNDLSQTAVTLGAGLAALLVFMGLGLAYALSRHLLSIVDTLWGLGFVVVAAVSAVVSLGGDGGQVQRWIVLAMVAVWGLRLAWHVGGRNHGQGEDPRYADLLEQGDKAGRSFARTAITRVFLPQGVAMFIVSAPLMVGPNNERMSVPLTIAGVVVWAVGLFFEAVGDAQLKKYKSDPDNKGKIMDKGLWSLTRHPNYFGDAAVWWGLGLVAAGSWPGLVALVGPAIMTYSLVNVTGAKLNEKSQRKKPGWDDYARRTSYFVPLPPKK
jgi:steroid 5-alpha reductase family enzyme